MKSKKQWQPDIYVMGKASRSKRLMRQLGAIQKTHASLEADHANLVKGKEAELEKLRSGQVLAAVLQRLDRNQIQAVTDVLNRTDTDEIGHTRMLKQYLAQHRADLERTGLDSDYAAYVLVANADVIRGMGEARRNMLN